MLCRAEPYTQEVQHHPLGHPSRDTYQKIASWIKENTPEWQEFSIAPSAKALGFFLGLQMGAQNWTEPPLKFKRRMKDIKAARASLSVNIYDFNSRVLPVTSYQAQLLPLSRTHFIT